MKTLIDNPSESIQVLLSKLSTYLSYCHSGTMLIATADNRSYRLALEAGRVTHCSYGRVHGDEAVRLITSIEVRSSSFSRDVFFPFRPIAAVEDKSLIDTILDQALRCVPSGPRDDAKRAVSDKPALVNSRIIDEETLPSGLTNEQMERLFGKFYFE